MPDIASCLSLATIGSMKSMTTITILFGVLLNVVGLVGFFCTGAVHPKALIPCALGLLLIIIALIGRKPDQHMHAMHAAVLVGLIGFGATCKALFNLNLVMLGHAGTEEVAIISKSATAFLCGLFVLRCIQSFIDARKAKKQGTAAY